MGAKHGPRHGQRRVEYSCQAVVVDIWTRATSSADGGGGRRKPGYHGKPSKKSGRQVDAILNAVSADEAKKVVIAYEPVWAIGTGKTASPEQAQETHAFIRAQLAELFDADTAKKVRIQYGGSVKPGNARELLGQPDIDGALVGGASLEFRSFSDIIKNCIDD